MTYAGFSTSPAVPFPAMGMAMKGSLGMALSPVKTCAETSDCASKGNYECFKDANNFIKDGVQVHDMFVHDMFDMLMSGIGAESEREGNTDSMLPARTHIVCDAKASAARRRACAAMAWS